MCNILHNFAPHRFEKFLTTEIVTCSMLNFRWLRRSDKWWYDYTYGMKWYVLCYTITILMGKCIGSRNHNQYLKYCQRILDWFFQLQQDLLQMATKTKLFLSIFFLTERCSSNAVISCNISLQAILYYKTIIN